MGVAAWSKPLTCQRKVPGGSPTLKAAPDPGRTTIASMVSYSGTRLVHPLDVSAAIFSAGSVKFQVSNAMGEEPLFERSTIASVDPP